MPGGCVAGEIYLDTIPVPRDGVRARPAYSPPSLQPISRDFAFIVPEDLTAEKLVRAIASADKDLIRAVRLFDRYQPAGGALSLAIEVTLQPAEKTLTDQEIGAISNRIVAAAAKVGARLRS